MAVRDPAVPYVAKKRCPMCNSSNPVPATSCEICGFTFAFEQSQTTHAAPSAVANGVLSPERMSYNVVQTSPPRSAPKALRNGANSPVNAQSAQSRSVAPVRSSQNRQIVATEPQPSTRPANPSADLAQFLRAADQPNAAGSTPATPMVAWVVISFVVLVLAVTATAVLLINGTVSNGVP